MVDIHRKFTEHVDADGEYHRDGVPEGGKKCCGLTYFSAAKHEFGEFHPETWESCCCQQCYECNLLVEQHKQYIRAAHDPDDTSEFSRNIQIKCTDPDCPALALCKKPLLRDVLTCPISSKKSGIPYLFCAHDGDRPKVECARGNCDECGWAVKVPRCKAIEEHTGIRWQQSTGPCVMNGDEKGEEKEGEGKEQAGQGEEGKAQVGEEEEGKVQAGEGVGKAQTGRRGKEDANRLGTFKGRGSDFYAHTEDFLRRGSPICIRAFTRGICCTSCLTVNARPRNAEH